MTSKQQRLILFFGLGLSFFRLYGQQAMPPAPPSISTPSGIFRGRVTDLQGQVFRVGTLKVSVQCDRPLIGGGGNFTLRVDNPSNEFIMFNPWDFLVVNSGGCQIQFKEAGISDQGQATSFIPFNVAPGAYAIRTYAIPGTERLKSGFKIYIGGKLLAEISD